MVPVSNNASGSAITDNGMALITIIIIIIIIVTTSMTGALWSSRSVSAIALMDRDINFVVQTNACVFTITMQPV